MHNSNIRTLRFFIYTYFVFVALLFLLIFTTPKGHEILWMYAHKSIPLNYVFFYLNKLGEWITIVILVGYIFIKKREVLLYFAIGFLAQSLLSSGLKKLFCVPRPLAYFNSHSFQLPSFIPKLMSNSFPSGHTTTAFFLASFFVFFIVPSKTVTFIVLWLAISVGVARMYLLAHFKEDVLAGSLIGVLCSSLVYYYFLQKKYKNAKVN